MITAPTWHKLPSSGANRPSEVAVTVDINVECNQIAVNPIIDCFSRDLVPEYCHGIESSKVYTVPPCFVESHPSRSNRSLPSLPLLMHGEEIIPTFLKSNIYIGLCLPTALTLKNLQSYTMFELLLIVRINRRVGPRDILNCPLLRDAFPYRLAIAIPLKEGVP